MKERNLIVMVGPIGSGKTTYSKALVNDTSMRISQDELGKEKHMEEFLAAINVGMPTVIIDRMNFNKAQRARYIEPAREKGYVINIVELKVGYATCFDRVVAREKHPTVEAGNPKLAKKILDFFFAEYQMPTEDEYDNYTTIEGDTNYQIAGETYMILEEQHSWTDAFVKLWNKVTKW